MAPCRKQRPVMPGPTEAEADTRANRIDPVLTRPAGAWSSQSVVCRLRVELRDHKLAVIEAKRTGLGHTAGVSYEASFLLSHTAVRNICRSGSRVSIEDSGAEDCPHASKDGLKAPSPARAKGTSLRSQGRVGEGAFRACRFEALPQPPSASRGRGLIRPLETSREAASFHQDDPSVCGFRRSRTALRTAARPCAADSGRPVRHRRAC